MAAPEIPTPVVEEAEAPVEEAVTEEEVFDPEPRGVSPPKMIPKMGATLTSEPQLKEPPKMTPTTKATLTQAVREPEPMVAPKEAQLMGLPRAPVMPVRERLEKVHKLPGIKRPQPHAEETEEEPQDPLKQRQTDPTQLKLQAAGMMAAKAEQVKRGEEIKSQTKTLAQQQHDLSKQTGALGQREKDLGVAQASVGTELGKMRAGHAKELATQKATMEAQLLGSQTEAAKSRKELMQPKAKPEPVTPSLGPHSTNRRTHQRP